MADRFAETTHTSYFSRLKSSFGGMLVGLLLAGSSFPLLWFNEGRAVRTARGLAEGAAAVTSVSAASIQSTNEGKLIHIAGPVTVTRHLEDHAFGVKLPALKLERVVEMLQWKEKSETTHRDTPGGGRESTTTYTYEQVWSPERISSSSFRHPEGHQNPKDWRFESQNWIASDARLEAFDMPARLIERTGAGEPLPLGSDAFTFTGTPAPVLHKERLYFSAKPEQPEVGDLRISFKVVRPGDFSLIAQQSVTSLIPYRTKSGTELDMISSGRVDARTMFDRAVKENIFITWMLRVLGWFLMFIGIRLLFEPLSALVRFVPFLGGLVGAGVSIFAAALASIVSLVIVGIAWMYYRPLLAIALLAIAAGIFLFVGSKYKKTAIG